MKRAIIYTRFSPRKDADTSESCETQQAYCEAHAEKMDYTVAAVFEDRAMSGSDADRPGLASAVAALKRGDVLLVYKRDRIARDVLLAELTLRQATAAGATIEAVTGDIAGDASDPTIAFVRQIMNAVAELERKQIADRTSAAMLHHQRNGRRMGRFAPYGWQVDPADGSRLVPLESELGALARIKELAGGGDSAYAIARKLQAEMPGAARCGHWNVRTVRKIMERAA
jgi:DNA invertase Pin-like site-specific DNA recombinase